MNYYAVERSTDHLTHYGVKGMHWGVRKAIERGGEKGARALSRQYAKAQKKLAKLNAKADIAAQQKKADKYNKISKISRRIGHAGSAVGLAGTGTDHTLRLITGLRKSVAKRDLKDLDAESSKVLSEYDGLFRHAEKQHREGKMTDQQYNRTVKELLSGHNETQTRLEKQADDIQKKYNSTANRNKTIADVGRYAGYIGGGIGALGYGAAIGSKIKARAAKKRTTTEGHVKAVSERNAWKNEMRDAFKGTKYANLPSVQSKRRRKSK